MPKNNITSKTKGGGVDTLDFRTRPDGAPLPPGLTQGDADVVNALQDAITEKFDPAAAEAKKKSSATATPDQSASGSGAGGTTPSAATSTSSAAASNRGSGTPPDTKPGASAGLDDKAAGRDNVDDSTAGPAETDPLKLLDKSFSKPTAEKTEGGAAPTSGGADLPTGNRLRTELESTLHENKTLREKLKGFEGDARIKELTTAWEAEKKARAVVEQRLAEIDYAQSPEFQTRYNEPYDAAVKEALEPLRSAETLEGKKLSATEIQQVLLGGGQAAFAFLKNNFEEGTADYLKDLVRDVYRTDAIRTRALEAARKDATERARTNAATIKARQESLRQAFDAQNEQRLGRLRSELELPDTDKALAKAIAEGVALADAAFIPNERIAPEQAVAISAEVRSRAAIMPAAFEFIQRQKARISELESELSRFKANRGLRSEAPTGSESPEVGGAEEGTMEWSKGKLMEMINNA